MCAAWPPHPPPLTINSTSVTTEDSFRFCGTTISTELKWNINIGSVVPDPHGHRGVHDLTDHCLVQHSNQEHIQSLHLSSRIIADPTHSGHALFELFPSGNRLGTIKTSTSRPRKEFPSSTVDQQPPYHFLYPPPPVTNDQLPHYLQPPYCHLNTTHPSVDLHICSTSSPGFIVVSYLLKINYSDWNMSP